MSDRPRLSAGPNECIFRERRKLRDHMEHDLDLYRVKYNKREPIELVDGQIRFVHFDHPFADRRTLVGEFIDITLPERMEHDV